jgi:hypothetical protein
MTETSTSPAICLSAEKIAAYLEFLGWEGADADLVYYLRRQQQRRGEPGSRATGRLGRRQSPYKIATVYGLSRNSPIK